MIASKLDAVMLDLLEASDRPSRVLAVAERLAALIHQQEAAAVLPHLRHAPPILLPGIAAVGLHARWRGRQGLLT